MPAAVSVFFDTPIKGHKPKNWLNTTLFTNAAATAINIQLTIYLSSFSSLSQESKLIQP